MWLGIFILIIAVVALIGGILAGGIFSIVLIPLAIILLVPTFFSLLRRRSAEGPGDNAAERSRMRAPYPHKRRSGTANQPAATPEDILKARTGAM